MNLTFYFFKILWAGVILALFSCQKNPDFEVFRSEILDLHQKMIDAHWNKDVDFFVSDMADDYLFVQNGEIQRPQKDGIIKRMQDYLSNTTFSEYRDLQEPIIGFSKDGSIAWSIVQVKVAGKRKLDNGSERKLDFTCAWITLYQRRGEKWLRLAEVSNFK